jgi:phosphoglycolate phosphatase-like HAD superfamily hydrolase
LAAFLNSTGDPEQIFRGAVTAIDNPAIRCVAFDFDGTLVLSNEIKRDGFFAVAARYPGGAARMKAILANPPGDRYAMFDRFAAEVGGDAKAMAAEYSRFCEEGIAACPLRPGAAAALAELRAAGLALYINSATPAEPLRAAVLRRFGFGVFRGIRGGHGAKVANLRAILAAENIAPAELAMVGDGIDDREAALAVRCRFVGVDAGTLAAALGPEGLLGDLGGLWPSLRDG